MKIPYAAAVGVTAVERLIPFMTEKMRARYDALTFTPKSAIIAAFPYNTGRAAGNIARYARVADYHEVILGFLKEAVGDKKGYHAVKNGWPLPLVPAAQLAGVGFTGRHGIQIVEPYGSYAALGAILCEHELEETGNASDAVSKRCGTCNACEKACPTGAMRVEGGRRVLNRELCIAGITQSKEPDRADLMGKSGYIWGCDLCQEACPYNAGAAVTAIPQFLNSAVSDYHEGSPPLPGRHYSGKEALLLRNLKISTAANTAAKPQINDSIIQMLSNTPT